MRYLDVKVIGIIICFFYLETVAIRLSSLLVITRTINTVVILEIHHKIKAMFLLF